MKEKSCSQTTYMDENKTKILIMNDFVVSDIQLSLKMQKIKKMSNSEKKEKNKVNGIEYIFH